MLVVSQPFGVKMYKSKTLLLQIADDFVEMQVGGGTSIVEYQYAGVGLAPSRQNGLSLLLNHINRDTRYWVTY